MTSVSTPARIRLSVLLVCALAIVPSCELGPIRIVAPSYFAELTHMPLDLWIDFDGAATAATFEVLLNGQDVTAEFQLESLPSGRTRARAFDVWEEGLVIAGTNTLVASVEIGGSPQSALRVFTTTGDPYADAVPAGGFVQGPGGGFGLAGFPDVVLGGPVAGEDLFNGSLDVLSLGVGGVLVLEFTDNVVVDGPGPDFTVFENPFMTQFQGYTEPPFAEPAAVSVSQDGVVFWPFTCNASQPDYFPGCAGVFPTLSTAGDPTSPHPSIPTLTPLEALVDVFIDDLVLPEGSGGDSYDLAALGFSWIRFVRIVDAGPVLGLAPTQGHDVDAVAAVHSAPATDANMNGVPDAVE